MEFKIKTKNKELLKKIICFTEDELQINDNYEADMETNPSELLMELIE